MKIPNKYKQRIKSFSQKNQIRAVKKEHFHLRNVVCNYKMCHNWEKRLLLGIWFLGFLEVSEQLYCEQLLKWVYDKTGIKSLKKLTKVR